MACSVLTFALIAGACQSTPPEPESHSVLKPAAQDSAAAAATPTPPPAPTPTPPAPTQKPTAKVSEDDPLHGKFSLDDATAGLAGKGPLSAEIDTELGKLVCDLYDDKAPITVANFVGLARGLRPFKAPDGKWTKKPAYDGTTFHRVIKGFMIQGGDPSGTGAGEPGYVIPDEVWPGATHDKRGLLCMANRGPNTNGQQFFITDAAAPHLDSGYTIFGKCGPDAVMDKLASVPVQGDHSVTPTKIKKITIKRKAK
ncbi:MAG TPA: peptidylprolyl isomerase [Polyangiaceae bacterium]|nr:peptidylprolyl isomerase [Polyangiaceae bacterium]